MNEYHPEILKYLMLSAHYRSILDFSPAQLEQVISLLARVYSSLAYAEKAAKQPADAATPADFAKAIADAKAGVESGLDDDFNTPEMLARLFEVLRLFNNLVRTPGPVTPKKSAIAKAYLEFVNWIGSFTSLFSEPPKEFLTFLDDMLLKKKNLKREDVDQLVNERSQARASKDFAKSDELRAKLMEMGIAVQDSPQGSEWEVSK